MALTAFQWLVDAGRRFLIWLNKLDCVVLLDRVVATVLRNGDLLTGGHENDLSLSRTPVAVLKLMALYGGRSILRLSAYIFL